MSTADTSPEVQRVLLLASEISAVHVHVRLLDSAELRELGRQDPVPSLKAFVATLGLGYAGAPVRRWDSIARTQARVLLREALRWQQAYDLPRVELALAEQIANAFSELFTESARFFTNGVIAETPTGLRVSGWYGSVTLATFEAGVVAADERRAGLLYVADED